MLSLWARRGFAHCLLGLRNNLCFTRQGPPGSPGPTGIPGPQGERVCLGDFKHNESLTGWTEGGSGREWRQTHESVILPGAVAGFHREGWPGGTAGTCRHERKWCFTLLQNTNCTAGQTHSHRIPGKPNVSETGTSVWLNMWSAPDWTKQSVICFALLLLAPSS